MRKVDTAYDELLKSNYDLYAVKFSELQTEVKSWYEGMDTSEFDNRSKFQNLNGNDYSIIKVSGIASNYFYAYKEQDGTMHLMDGFNRLLTTYGKLPIDPMVYIKVLTDNLSDNRLMNIMFRLNMWKLASDGESENSFRSHNFLDRGFRLFINTKFNIKIKTIGHPNDMSIIDEYFRDEQIAVYFNYKISELFKLFINDRIVDDLRDIITDNTYTSSNQPFNNYIMFFEGFVRFLARRRLRDKMGDHRFETYLDMLKADTKFFKKLKGMSSTDSTRQNIYKFFTNVEGNLDGTNY